MLQLITETRHFSCDCHIFDDLKPHYVSEHILSRMVILEHCDDYLMFSGELKNAVVTDFFLRTPKMMNCNIFYMIFAVNNSMS